MLRNLVDLLSSVFLLYSTSFLLILQRGQCVAIFQAGQKAVIEKLCKAVLGRGVWGAKPPTVHTFFPLKKMLLHVILGIFLNLMRKKKETKNV